MLRLVQLAHPTEGRSVAVVDEPYLRILRTFTTVYDCAMEASRSEQPLAKLAEADAGDQRIEYDATYFGRSDWRLLTPLDHPHEMARCLVSGTGLTHRKSAANRDAMHQGPDSQHTEVTDSMRMYQWGQEGGRPAQGDIGIQPEWFYKGTGAIVRAPNEPLDIPDFADDGGEEPEIVGLYIIDAAGEPRRVGFASGNEFSDHSMERRNYLYLAPSKLRTCSFGPELIVDSSFDLITGTVSLERNGRVFWSQPITTGEEYMVHSLANLEYHHFKYPSHRRAGDAHVHFFGADAFSFGSGVSVKDGDVMVVAWNSFGRPLRNVVNIDKSPPQSFQVRPL